MARRGVLVLGAGGFIGRAVVARLTARGEPAVAATRATTGALSAASDWPALVADMRAVVHLAGRAHAPPAPGDDWIAAEEATAHALGTAARAAGVERIVLMSSVKVHGDASGARPFRADDALAPADAYGRAKVLTEAALSGFAGLVVLRPPLVYGPGVKANFRALIGLVARGLPLPLASVRNARSLVFLDNLLDLVELALAHERAPGQAFLLRDDGDAATPDLIRLIARGLGRSARLLPCPPAALRLAATLIGRGDAAERLLGSLVVDDAPTRALLGWRPRVALADGIAATCRAFRAETGR